MTPSHLISRSSSKDINSPWIALARTSVLWPGVLILILGSFWSYRNCDPLDVFGFVLIVLSAFLPSYLWCSRQVYGIPLFPLYALCTIWAFALPLISGHPIVILYPVLARFKAALTVTISTLIGTAAWYVLARQKPKSRARCLALEASRSEGLFFITLIVGISYNVFLSSIYLFIPGAFFSLLKQVIIALGNLAVFVLAYRYGTKELKPNYRWFFGFAFCLLVLSSLPGLYLVTTMSYVILAVSGFVLGRGKIPWVTLCLLLCVFSFLHLGKSEMRDKYWIENNAESISITDYPRFLAEWAGKSLDNVSFQKSTVSQGPIVEDHQSFITRSSLMHLLLLEQSLTPSSLPYLQGFSYSMIPEMLVPRFLNANKYSVTVGTNFLAVYYGLIDSNQPINTTIGFGMLNEAYANFGYTGCVVFSLLIGLFYGFLANFSAAYPLLSLRSLLSVLVMAMAFQDEFTSCVYVSAIFQSSIVLSVVSFFFMKRIPVPGYRPKPFLPVL